MLQKPMNAAIRAESCPVCANAYVTAFANIENVPVHCNRLWSSRIEARAAPTGNILLCFCTKCGHIYNPAFQPELMQYDTGYENALHFSPRFQQYAIELAKTLIDKYRIRNKQIIEVGCGDGHFLSLLCQFGENRGIGFDKSHRDDKATNLMAQNHRITFVRDFFSEKYARYDFALLCCRHVLEHIWNPAKFIMEIYRIAKQKPAAMVFFEVPNVSFILDENSIWDIIYEHYSYYSAISLTELFTRCGFKIAEVYEAYQRQFLIIEAFPDANSQQTDILHLNELDDLNRAVTNFMGKYNSIINSYKQRLKELADSGKKVVLWGGGSKGISFLNMLGLHEEVKFVVDLNPRKHGRYIPGTGQKIIAPESLVSYQPDAVIILNPIYKEEIYNMIDGLGLTVDFIP